MDRLACGLIEIKFDAGDTETMSFSGYGAVFKNVDSYGDVIDPGAFANYLSDVKAKKRPYPAMLSQHGAMGHHVRGHDPDRHLDGPGGRRPRPHGEGKFADTPRGREIYQLMKMAPRPAIDGLSIGYIAKKYTMGTKPSEPRRTLHAIDLVEISPVTFPANGKARVGAVKSIEELSTVRDLEEALCERFSKTEALALIARAKSIFASPGDPDGNGGPGDPEAELAALVRRNTAVLKAA
jgi:HK97 family phage prohead protease